MPLIPSPCCSRVSCTTFIVSQIVSDSCCIFPVPAQQSGISLGSLQFSLGGEWILGNNSGLLEVCSLSMLMLLFPDLISEHQKIRNSTPWGSFLVFSSFSLYPLFLMVRNPASIYLFIYLVTSSVCDCLLATLFPCGHLSYPI